MKPSLILMVAAAAGSLLHAHPEDFHIVVYGGTSGGVTAAVQAARMGKRVALVTPTRHLGGLTTSGLGWTDLGDVEILGGLSRDFYHEVYQHYLNDAAWDKQTRASFGNTGQGGQAFNATLQIASVFEPKVAKGIFDAWIADHGVSVFQARLDLNGGVVMQGSRITALRVEDGRLFRGKMFIDASYEGDVLAGAGVSFTIGREANAKYGETISGIQVSSGAGNQLRDGIDPYVVAGNAASGLLPGVEPDAGGVNGTGDSRLQAYCFRMCLTNLASNRVTIPQPAGYNENDYEILFRSIEAGQTGTFFKLDPMPNKKTDSNNSGGISTDFIGKNYGPGWNWATLDHAGRDALAKAHENWQRGLIWSLQNHPRVLAVFPNGLYQGWGLPADEFTDNGNWPWQLYVREARRMVSDYVMTQKNCVRSVVAPDPVAMAAYTMDSHHVQRHLRNGMVKNEGDVQSATSGAYPVSYRSIIPKQGECENLLVPWCLSASHMAFGSIRMEPVFMALGQSSATAAAMAIDAGTSVQNLPYDNLAAKLRADGQALGAQESGGGVGVVIVDNKDPGATLTGTWTPSTSTAGYYGADYLTNGNTGQGTKSVRFTPNLPEAGTYQVKLRWTALANRATNVPVKIFHNGGVFSTIVNQELNGSVWNLLGSFEFAAGGAGSLLIETTGANEYVIADAAMWVSESGVRETVGVIASIPTSVRGGGLPAELVFTRSGEGAGALTVYAGAGGSVQPWDLSEPLPESVVFAAGQRTLSLPLSAPQGPVPLGPGNLVVSLLANPSYVIGPRAAATLTFHDEPFDSWRFGVFEPGELENATISGALSDPDGDGVANLLEFLGGGDPHEADAGKPPRLIEGNGLRYLEIPRATEAESLRLIAEESDDLSSWDAVPELTVPWPRRSEGGTDYLAVPLGAADAGGDTRFFRLRVER